MRRISRALATALLLAGLILVRPPLAVAQRAPVPREALEALEASLDRAVGQVSRPAPGIVLGRAESARGYHLPGYGAVFVLAPRALPRGGSTFAFQPRVAPGGRARPQFEARVERDGGPLPAAGENPDIDELLVIEQQVLEFQHEAEETRQTAELEFERLTRDFRNRLAVPPAGPHPAGGPVVAPGTGASPISPAPPPSALPLPPGVEGPLPPPPWRFWFPTDGPRDDRPPDTIVADVRAAVIATLASDGARLRGLATEEFVAVAIDFVPVGVFVSQARPARTILIRARKRDLDARQAGKLSADELRSRVEVSEY
jgi:hypothetical protein